MSVAASVSSSTVVVAVDVGKNCVALSVTDAGAGVDPQSLTAKIDGKTADVAYSRGRGVVSLRTAGPGRHTLVFTAADYQELKNMENVPQILPNTRTFRAVFRVG